MTYSVKFLTINRGGFMPKSSRLKSSTGYHHIMLRGINRSNIFESDQDKTFFEFNETGASIRDLGRGLGIGKSIVERTVKI